MVIFQTPCILNISIDIILWTISVKRITKNDFNNTILQPQYSCWRAWRTRYRVFSQDVERLTSMRPTADTVQLFPDVNEGNERYSQSVTWPRGGNEVVSYLGSTPYNYSPRFVKWIIPQPFISAFRFSASARGMDKRRANETRRNKDHSGENYLVFFEPCRRKEKKKRR